MCISQEVAARKNTGSKSIEKFSNVIKRSIATQVEREEYSKIHDNVKHIPLPCEHFTDCDKILKKYRKRIAELEQENEILNQSLN